jgi:hypothetical protein
MADQLTKDQLDIIRLIEKEAIKAGLNPDFALAVAQAESAYKHIPATDTSSTAFGPFQVNKPTAKTLGVDYDAMVKDPQLAVRAGIQNLLSHANNPKLEGDPARIIAAHHWGADSPFASTGDLKHLNKEHANYIAGIGELLPTGEFPETVLHTKGEEPKVSKEEVAEEPAEENIYGGTPVTEYEDQRASRPVEMGAASGLTGAGLGTVYSVKAPAVRMAQRIGLLPGGKPISPTEAAQLVEKTMTDNASAPSTKALHGGEKWQKSLTGISTPGAQMSKDSLDLAKDMQSAVGIKGAPGFTGGTITEGGIILSPQEAAAVQAKSAATATPLPVQPNAAQRVAKSILASSPVRGGLAGFGLGYGVQDAYNRYMGEKPGQAALSALGTAASAAAPFVGTAASIPLAGAGALIPAYLQMQDDPEAKAKFLKGMSGKGAYANRGFGLD